MAAPAMTDVLDAAPDGMGVLGTDGALTLSNKALLALFPAATPGRSPLELTRSEELQALAQAALSGKAGQMELTLAVSRRVLLSYLSPLPQGGALWVVRDITEAKRMERARRDFVANASHELRTPVSAIAGAAETLLDGALDDRAVAQSFAEMIARHADRLAHLTQELLDLSRIESGDWQFRIGPIEVKSVAHAVFDLLRSRAEARHMMLVAEPTGLSVLADRRAVEQMVLNLVDNAIKYTPERGTITLKAEQTQGQVLLSVCDTGPGIEPHHLERLFERFYRVDPGRSREAGGTGLGLSIVKHLAQAQKGEVGVETGPTGSRFWIRLPAP